MILLVLELREQREKENLDSAGRAKLHIARESLNKSFRKILNVFLKHESQHMH